MSDDRATNRWQGITALAFGAAGFGVLLSKPPLLLASVVAIAYAAFARSGAAPSVELAVERSLSDHEPDAGDTVTVRTTVRNEGDALADLRVFDGVPDGLTVTGGAARTATALRAGGSTTFEYEVPAERGRHAWGDLTAVARDASGAREVETTVEGPATPMTVVPRLGSLDAFPLRPLTTPHTGRVASQEAGPGVEFHSLREYRHGDPLGRVAWKHLARTGELATEEFHAERMASVLLTFDVRARAYAEAGGEDAATAAEHCMEAGRLLAGTLLDAGDQVGAAGLGPENCYLEPGLGRAHRTRLREFLATAPALSKTPPTEPFYPTQLVELRKRIRGELQVLWLSPLLDDYAVEVARKFESAGHAVTVVSPDVTVADTPGGRLVRAERRQRLLELREAGVRVLDWHPSEPFQAATGLAVRGWRS